MHDPRLALALLAAIKPIDQQTAMEAAKAAHAVLLKFAADYGQSPEIETGIGAPNHFGGEGASVYWDAGPYQWGVEASIIISSTGTRLVETHYGLDLCFYDEE
jgi:hypothetical protein